MGLNEDGKLGPKILGLFVLIILFGAGLVFMMPSAYGDVMVYHYWTSGTDKEAMETLASSFEENTGISLDLNAFTGYQDKISLVIDSNPPDLAAHWFNKYYENYALRGSLLDLTDFWAEEGLDDVFPQKVAKLVEVNGRKYGVPLDIHWEGGVVLYNLRVFGELGLSVPHTWEEFQTTLQTLKANGVEHPIAMGFADAWPRDMVFTAIFAAVAGPDFYLGLANGENSWTDAPVQEAFEIYRQWVENGYFDPSAPGLDWEEALNTFINGETAIYFMGDWAATALKKIGWQPNVDYYVDFIPAKPGIEQFGIPDVEGFVIPSKANNVEGAKEFLKFMARADAQIAFASIKGSISPHSNAQIQTYGDNIQISMWQKAESWDWALPLMWYFPQSVRNVFGDKMYEIWSDPTGVDIASICAEIQQAV